MRRVVSKHNALKHYNWGEGCDGWKLVDEENFSVNQERMPVHTAEKRHYHKHTNQFFYILYGVATFEIEDTITQVQAGEGLVINAGEKHRILNNEPTVLEFILCSQPATENDRINCEP